MQTPPDSGEVETTMCSETENQNQSCYCSPQSDPYDTEPADPSRLDHNVRLQLPLIPDTVKASLLPDPLRDGDRPLTVGEARDVYIPIERSWLNTDYKKSKHRGHKKHYWGVHEVERRILEYLSEPDDLTTVMFTRRLSPLDEYDNLLTLWECDEMLNGGCIRRSVREALNYHLGDFEFWWFAVTAPTRSAATPHEHQYIWIDDPENEITTDHIAPALGKHLKHCPNAYERHHQYRRDGSDGAITVHHSPEIRSNGNTEGVTYVASQLAYLPIADLVDSSKDDPADQLFEGAALAWARGDVANWFRSSSG